MSTPCLDTPSYFLLLFNWANTCSFRMSSYFMWGCPIASASTATHPNEANSQEGQTKGLSPADSAGRAVVGREGQRKGGLVFLLRIQATNSRLSTELRKRVRFGETPGLKLANHTNPRECGGNRISQTSHFHVKHQQQRDSSVCGLERWPDSPLRSRRLLIPSPGAHRPARPAPRHWPNLFTIAQS